MKAIRDGDCDIAIAGGVNALLTPTLYLSFTKAGMLSEDGRCKTFDKSANGYVRGEGAGAIILKPLSKALRDDDTIYGVIKGSAVNHGGHVSSLTVPNPNAQADVIITACEHAHIDVETISYIEAHGTGTSLGDPIEVNGLKKAFEELRTKEANPKQTTAYCGLGTVKTNIGHLEAAAGIAGVIKVLLAMQHKKLPGLVNFKELNPYIEIKDSPFYLVEKTQGWERLKDNEGREIPYRAGVSSFGFGGANAHVVIEEAPERANRENRLKPSYLLVLSAKTDHALSERMQILSNWLSQKDHLSIPISAIAYTLNSGRGHFTYRVAIVADSIENLNELLKEAQQKRKNQNYFIGSVENKALDDAGIYEKVLESTIDELKAVGNQDAVRYKKNLRALANLYVKGYELNWDLLHQNESKQKIPLPTYPFGKERYWIPATIPHVTVSSEAALHPLLDKNVSTLSAEIFTKVLTGNEFYLADHHVKGKAVLPGAAYIEMARAAGMLAMPDEHVVRLRNIIWERPIVMGTEPQTVTMSLYPEESGVAFEVTTAVNESEPQVHAQGKILTVASPVEPQALALGLIKARCLQQQNREDIYTYYRSMGLEYGSGFQVIQSLSSNEREVLAKIQLPAHLESGKEAFVLHPSLLDGALQATVGFMQEEHALSLPFSLGEIEIFGTLPSTCYVYVSLPKFQIQMADESGKVKVVIKDFTARVLRKEGSEEKAQIHAGQPVSEPIISSDEGLLLEKVQTQAVKIISELLKIQNLDAETELSEYGADSISLTLFADEINAYYGLELTPAILFEHQTLRSFATYLVNEHREAMLAHHSVVKTVAKDIVSETAKVIPKSRQRYVKKAAELPAERREEDIAIIGMSGVFPGSPDLDAFWKNLEEQKDLISEIPASRWDWHAYYGEGEHQTKVKWGGFIDGIDQFDAGFFAISPREAELMDPQQRLFLEAVWKAVEDAGYTPEVLAKAKTGLFVGVSSSDYTELLQQAIHEDSAYTPTGNTHSVLSNRVSYLLNLHGPSEAVDTACSSSLVAIHNAVKAIRGGDCDIAIAGGVNALLTPTLYLSFTKAGMLSEDGRCKTFDKSANGYVRGEGAGAIILKPLSKALRDDDTIYGVIKGTCG